MKKLSYEQLLDMIIIHATEIYNKRGSNQITEQQVRLAAETTYYEGVSDLEWLAQTLKELGGSPK